jgi:hypothetical protein
MARLLTGGPAAHSFGDDDLACARLQSGRRCWKVYADGSNDRRHGPRLICRRIGSLHGGAERIGHAGEPRNAFARRPTRRGDVDERLRQRTSFLMSA